MESTLRSFKDRTRALPVLAAFVAVAAFLEACDYGKPAPDVCLMPSALPSSAPVTTLDVHFVAGQNPLVIGSEVSASGGAKVRPSKARFFLSELKLVDGAGRSVQTELTDEDGNRLPYGLTLVDFERPASMKIRLRAPAGSYRGLSVSVGVPTNCETGERLNHSDASAMKPPLDVDTDMYWSWNPGYVFLKFEGQVGLGSGWDRFFYHVGEDDRFATLELRRAFTIAAEGGAGPTIVADFERLLTSAAGEARPDLKSSGQRRVHGGDLASALAENIRHSDFLRLEPAHH
jgi:hypothetical protein